jgi:hypothetical protein
MANILKNSQGRATIAGSTIYTVGTGETLTIVGIRAANNDNSANHTFHLDVNGFLITGIETPLPVGSALEASEGTKVVVEEGDVITAYSDADNVVDLTLSFLEQTPA